MATSKNSPTPGESGGITAPPATSVAASNEVAPAEKPPTNVEVAPDLGPGHQGSGKGDDVALDETKIPTMDEMVAIRYVGRSDRRTVSLSSLRRLGVEPKGEEDLVWEESNGFLVKASQVNAETRDFFAIQPDFRIE